MSNLERELEKNGIFATRTAGDSMKPMLYDGCKVIIVPPVFPLKKYDIPVYRRDGHYAQDYARYEKRVYNLRRQQNQFGERRNGQGHCRGFVRFLSLRQAYPVHGQKICEIFQKNLPKFYISENKAPFPQLTSLFF